MQREEIEKMGARVMAVTKHEDGLSYDAHLRVNGRKRLVRGEVMPTHHTAIYALWEAIQYVGI
jgi:hypothetical protein